jgi:hypothetical protein
MLSRASSLVYGRSPSVRHTCGYTLANKGRDTRAIQGWLGHRSITSTACLHGAGAEPVQGLLAGLNTPEPKGPSLLTRRIAQPDHTRWA